jgi:hypothetical protein
MDSPRSGCREVLRSPKLCLRDSLLGDVEKLRVGKEKFFLDKFLALV